LNGGDISSKLPFAPNGHVGGLPTYVRPGWNGGLIIDPPGEAPTYLRLEWSGGYTIDPPEGPDATVKPLWGGEVSTALPVPVPITIGD